MRQSYQCSPANSAGARFSQAWQAIYQAVELGLVERVDGGGKGLRRFTM
jgi:hypothetical protein